MLAALRSGPTRGRSADKTGCLTAASRLVFAVRRLPLNRFIRIDERWWFTNTCITKRAFLHGYSVEFLQLAHTLACDNFLGRRNLWRGPAVPRRRDPPFEIPAVRNKTRPPSSANSGGQGQRTAISVRRCDPVLSQNEPSRARAFLRVEERMA